MTYTLSLSTPNSLLVDSARITEQCANLTMAFRTNYHAYVSDMDRSRSTRCLWCVKARADLDEIRQKTEIRLKTIADEGRTPFIHKSLTHVVSLVSEAQEALAQETRKLGEFNGELERDSLHLAHLKASIDIIA